MADKVNTTELTKRAMLGLTAFVATAAASGVAVADVASKGSNEWFKAKAEYVSLCNEMNSGKDDDGKNWSKAWHRLEKITPPSTFELSEKIRLLETEIDENNPSNYFFEYLLRDLKAMGVR